MTAGARSSTNLNQIQKFLTARGPRTNIDACYPRFSRLESGCLPSRVGAAEGKAQLHKPRIAVIGAGPLIVSIITCSGSLAQDQDRASIQDKIHCRLW